PGTADTSAKFFHQTLDLECARSSSVDAMTDAAVPVGTPPRPTAAPSSIGEVCDHLGITAHTARYYERIGLIEVGRSPSGHRVFDQRAVDRLDFLVRMRSSGMGISELTRYVDLVNQGESTIPERLQIVRNQ